MTERMMAAAEDFALTPCVPCLVEIVFSFSRCVLWLRGSARARRISHVMLRFTTIEKPFLSVKFKL